MKRTLLACAVFVSVLAAFNETLPISSTSGIWGEGFVGPNFTGGTREDQNLSGFGLNGGAGLAWWVHHNIGLRSQFRFMDYNFRPAADASPKLTYSYMGYGVWGAAMIRFTHENSKIQPYIGGGGGYFWPFYGTRKADDQVEEIPSDSLEATALYGGFLGVFFRIPHNALWKLEGGYEVMGDDYLINIGTGFSFKAFW